GDTFRFLRVPPAAGVRCRSVPLSQAVNERTGALASHRYSTPRYRPSAHALDTRMVGATGGATATMTPFRTSTIASPSPALPLVSGFADTLLRRVEADEQAFVLR